MKDNERLRKLIQENPELPLVFYVSTENLCWDYSSTVFEGCYCKVGTVYIDDEQTYYDFDSIMENYMDYLSDEEEYKNMSDEEYEKAIEKYINENIKHYKAIIVEVGF